MRILVITAFYPPNEIGGWEQMAQEINHHLVGCGHTVRTLTSNYSSGAESGEDPHVDRILELESDQIHYDPVDSFLRRKRRRRENLERVATIVRQFDPEVILVHVMWNLSRAIPWLAEQLRPGRVVYYLANDWPYGPSVHSVYWSGRAARRLLEVPKRALAPFVIRLLAHEDSRVPLRFDHVLCVSEYVRREFVRRVPTRPRCVSVVRNGVDVEVFAPLRRDLEEDGVRSDLSLLFAGAVVAHKGVHTAIEAVEILTRKTGRRHPHLTIAGAGHPDYERKLRDLVRRANLEDVVHFGGRVAREEMPALLARFDVLILPSVWQEPLARITQEAMAAGALVVGTLTGGTGELLIDGETGLTFDPENATQLASRIEELQADGQLRRRLRFNACERIVQEFDIRWMFEKIDGYLESLTDDGPANSGETRLPE